ncbi:MAG: 30S ribosomal protein S1 [Pseudomonadota bacterium]
MIPSNLNDSSNGNGLELAGEDNFEQLLDESLKQQNDFKQGSVIRGTVVKIENDQVLVDIGYKSEGYINIHEFSDLDRNITVKPGDEIEVLIEETEDDTGNIVLSKDKADKMKVWDKIENSFEKGEVIEGRIMDRVKGGLSVDIGVKAFLPGSQIDLIPVKNLDAYLGKKLNFKLIKFNKKRGNIVLSRKALLETERKELRTETMKHLKEGAILKGIVKNITEYGAFIDLGGIDGLLHITDMSWGRVNHPSEMFSIGDEVNVMVLKYDENNERVSLGLKQITPDPWVEADKKYPISQKIKGKIVSITDYGAFVELEEGIEGLIHISEMSWTKRVKHPSKLVAIGDVVEAVILDIDVPNKRISLGMRQTEPNPWEELAKKYPVGSVLTGEVKKVADFGIFVGVDTDIDGLVHTSDLSWNTKTKHPSDLFSKGEEVQAIVLSLDVENERFTLGIKQLKDDPWKLAANKYSSGDIIKGKITKLTDFGIFVQVENEIEGLVHKKEIYDKDEENKPKFNSGDEIEAMVISIDPDERKMALSIKAVQNAEDRKAIEEFNKDSKTAAPTFGDLMPTIGEKQEEPKAEEPVEETKAEEAIEEVKAEEPKTDEAVEKVNIEEPKEEALAEAKEEEKSE